MRTIVFDLDGTLADTSGDLLNAANVAFQEMGHGDIALDHSVAQDRATAMQGGRAMLTLGLTRAGRMAEGEITRGYPILLRAYGADISTHTTFFPGCLAAIQRLRDAGHPIAICTNKPEALAEQLMADLNARHLFDALVGADTLPVRKPDPAPLAEAVRLAGGDPAHCVLLGDTVTDRETARAAGIPSILVTFGPLERAVEDLHPEALLEHYDELDAVLARV